MGKQAKSLVAFIITGRAKGIIKFLYLIRIPHVVLRSDATTETASILDPEHGLLVGIGERVQDCVNAVASQ